MSGRKDADRRRRSRLRGWVVERQVGTGAKRTPAWRDPSASFFREADGSCPKHHQQKKQSPIWIELCLLFL